MERTTIIETALSILNKMAEARFDGQNTQYVNNMQPEVDFEQDKNLVNGFFDEGVGNIVTRIEPYVVSCEETKPSEVVENERAAESEGYVFSLRFPEDWKSNLLPSLEKKMENYLVHYIIAQWLEKVSMADTEYTMDKAKKLLGDIKWTCEVRKGKVHRIWNGTY